MANPPPVVSHAEAMRLAEEIIERLYGASFVSQREYWTLLAALAIPSPDKPAPTRIAKLADLPEGWHVEGRFRAPLISAAAIAKAEAVQAMLSDLWPVPTCDGGVQLEAHALDFDIEIEVSPDGLVCDVYAELVTKKEAPAIPSPDLRAFIEKCRHEAYKESGGAWEAGYAHGLLHAADELSALLGDPVSGPQERRETP